jgi:hypothetical protein
MIVLGNVLIVEIGDPKIQDYGKNKGKIENSKIDPEAGGAYFKLHCSVESQNIDRLNDQV